MKYRVQWETYVNGSDLTSHLGAASAALEVIENGGHSFTVRKVLQRGKGGLGPEFRVDLFDKSVVRLTEKDRPQTLWDDNLVQAMRLVDEADAAGAFTHGRIRAMAESMDLAPDQVVELIGRLRNAWSEIKKEVLS